MMLEQVEIFFQFPLIYRSHENFKYLNERLKFLDKKIYNEKKKYEGTDRQSYFGNLNFNFRKAVEILI
jgi:hypothetical protein